MISLQSSMHSSQMYTPGPAMSLRTCSCDLPQKLHLSWPFSSPNLNKRFVPLRWALLRRFRRALARLPAHHRVADPVGDCFLCSHVVIALHVALDLLERLAGRLDVDAGEQAARV